MNTLKDKKGIVLITACMVLMVLLILTTIFFSSLLTEKNSVDSEKYNMQALNLAEGGASQAIADLKKRVRTDLKVNVELPANRLSSTYQAYLTADDSLGFLRDFAYASGGTQFSVSGNQATLTLSPLDLNTGVQGNYVTTLIVTPNGSPSSPSADVYVFPYNYSVQSQASISAVSPAFAKTLKLVQGHFTVTVRRDNFAKYALFTSHHRTPSGTTVWFTSNTNFTGPVSTNERFSFANNPSGHFTEEVTQHETKARFYNNGWPVLMNADSNPGLDVPVFDQGFQRGYDLINLESSLSQTDLRNQALGTMANPGSNGIYVPNDAGAVTGGIYIKGNSTVDMSLDGSNNPVYTITQGSTTKSVTVNYTSNQTSVYDGSTTNTYQGIPDGVSNEGTLIYSSDDITGFSGTVQQNTSITVASERDVVVTNHVRYQQYTASPLSAEGYNNLLGIISWGGDVRIGTAAPNNLDIHGVVMAPHGIFTVDDYNLGSPRGTATLLGGAITDFYGAFGTFSGTTPISGYGRNFVYDPRMLQGEVPPYFPYMSNFTSFDDGGLDAKLIWKSEGV